MSNSQPQHVEEEARRAAINVLAVKYRMPLTRYFQRRAAPQDIPDLIQEVFLRLTRMHDPAKIAEAERFIFTVAFNVLRDEARRGLRHAIDSVPVEEVEIESSDFGQDRVIESREAAQRLRQALATLPERTRVVFALRFFEDWKMADVARSLGISTRAAEKHQTRAIAYVTAQLREWRDD